ncbi:MAG TPA: SRPBCC family protein [Solirubrobacteraceae bacterium]|jgi:hypothetical protein
MSIVTATIDIPAAPAEVWKVIMDPARLGDWVTIHRGLRHADSGLPRVGFEMDQRLHLRGVSLDVHWRLIECEPNRHAVWEGRGPARSRARTEYTLSPATLGPSTPNPSATSGKDSARESREGTGTRFDYSNEFRPPLGPIGALASRALVGGMPEREARHTLERLRTLLSGGCAKGDTPAP